MKLWHAVAVAALVLAGCGALEDILGGGNTSVTQTVTVIQTVECACGTCKGGKDEGAVADPSPTVLAFECHRAERNGSASAFECTWAGGGLVTLKYHSSENPPVRSGQSVSAVPSPAAIDPAVNDTPRDYVVEAWQGAALRATATVHLDS